MKILCIGHSSWDITVPVEDYPLENAKYRYNEKYSAGGGPAANAAYLLGKWGMDTVISSSIGSDDFGNRIKKEFQDINVNTDYLETSFDKETSLSFILINKKSGARTIFNVATEHPALKKIKYEFMPDIILSDGHDYGATQSALNSYPNAISVIDAGRPVQEVTELCKYMKHIVCSKEFAEEVTGLKFDFENSTTLVDVYNRLQDKYPSANIIITLEDKGAIYQANSQIKIMPGLKNEAVDTTAAGDIFHGAFVYGLANNFDMEKIITIANIAAGMSITKMGGRLSIPTLSEVLEYYTQKFGAPVVEDPATDAQDNVTPAATSEATTTEAPADPNTQPTPEQATNTTDQL